MVERYNKILVNSNKQGINPQVYTFDRYIFLGYIALLIIFFFLIVILQGGLSAENNLYVKCDSNSMCANPLYHEYKYCNNAWLNACDQKFIPQGFTFGKPEPKIMNNFILIVMIGLLTSLFVNHFLYNKNFKFK